MKLFRLRWLTVLVVAALLAASCGGSDDDEDAGADETTGSTEESAGGYSPSGTLRIGHGALRPGPPTPYASASSTDGQLLYAMWEGLVYLDEGVPKGRLAESFEVAEDGRSINFKLREDVVFADGEPFNAEAVKANIEFVQTAAADVVLPPISTTLSTIESVEVVGPHEVVLNLTGEYSLETLINLSRQGGLMVSPPALANVAGIVEGDAPGTGPYKLNKSASAVDYSTIVLDANETYWTPEDVGLEHIEITRVPDNGSRAAAFNSGQYDVVLAYSEMGEPQGGYFEGKPTNVGAVWVLDWQGEKIPQLANKEVRCAMRQSWDVEGLARRLQLPPEQIRTQPAADPNSYGWIDDLDAPEYDLEAAKARFEATGEEPFKMHQGYVSGSLSATAWHETLEAGLNELGITWDFEQLDNPALISQNHVAGKYELQNASLVQPHLLLAAIANLHPDSPLVPSGAAPEGVAELVESARTKSVEDAEADLAAAFKIVLEECIMWPYVTLALGYWISDDVEGWESLPPVWDWEPRGVRIKS